MALGYGVMVTLQILVLSFQVRILVAQQETKQSKVKESGTIKFCSFFVLVKSKKLALTSLILRVFC